MQTQTHSTHPIKRYSTMFLQAVIVFAGIATLVALIWEPQTEGVNAHATNFDIYFGDPFLALVYTGSVSFFIALYQAFKVLGYIRQDKIFSTPAVKALRIIKYCALVIVGFVAIEAAFILLLNSDDDHAGGIFIGVLITFCSIVITTTAAIFERILQNAVDIKSENDLTV